MPSDASVLLAFSCLTHHLYPQLASIRLNARQLEALQSLICYLSACQMYPYRLLYVGDPNRLPCLYVHHPVLCTQMTCSALCLLYVWHCHPLPYPYQVPAILSGILCSSAICICSMICPPRLVCLALLGISAVLPVRLSLACSALTLSCLSTYQPHYPMFFVTSFYGLNDMIYHHSIPGSAD